MGPSMTSTLKVVTENTQPSCLGSLAWGTRSVMIAREMAQALPAQDSYLNLNLSSEFNWEINLYFKSQCQNIKLQIDKLLPKAKVVFAVI